MITTNEYFNGNVKSLGYTSEDGKSTLGLMEPGEYEFGTSTHELMTVIQGELIVQLPNSSEFKSFKAGEAFEVDANNSFTVKTTVFSSYLCQYN